MYNTGKALSFTVVSLKFPFRVRSWSEVFLLKPFSGVIPSNFPQPSPTFFAPLPHVQSFNFTMLNHPSKSFIMTLHEKGLGFHITLTREMGIWRETQDIRAFVEPFWLGTCFSKTLFRLAGKKVGGQISFFTVRGRGHTILQVILIRKRYQQRKIFLKKSPPVNINFCSR